VETGVVVSVAALDGGSALVATLQSERVTGGNSGSGRGAGRDGRVIDCELLDGDGTAEVKRDLSRFSKRAKACSESAKLTSSSSGAREPA